MWAPSLFILVKIRCFFLSEPEDHFQVDGVDYAFVTDVQKLTPSKNNQKPGEFYISTMNIAQETKNNAVMLVIHVTKLFPLV